MRRILSLLPAALRQSQADRAEGLREDLTQAIAASHSGGGMEKEDRDRLLGALDLAERRVDEIMTHRSKIDMVDADQPPDTLISAILASAHSRLPVFRGEEENILGVIHAKELLREVDRLRRARAAVVEESAKVQQSLQELGPKDAHHELAALLDVHLMLMEDTQLQAGVKHWISERLYNAEWALTAQLETISRQFDEMEDPYLRERKADLEQVVERMLRVMRGAASPMAAGVSSDIV